ncbi:Zinc resistance-associated protein [Bordetella sputigena]|uniref:periplasmic heavy metal sensor n=1 Tax=Bordetella sputigena TaxID=1416810 RepID=UPI0039EF44C7
MMGRGWKIALVGSLVLNAFLLGGLAGGAYQWFSVAHVGETAAAPRAALRFAADELSPERRQQFLRALRQARRQGHEDALAAREARQDVLEQLAAPQLDRAALDAALARTRAADAAVRTRVEHAVADFAASLSPQERMAFVEGLRRRGEWRQPAAAGKAPARDDVRRGGVQ